MSQDKTTYLLADEDTNSQKGNKEDNDQNKDDTGLALSPVLLTLGQLVESVLAASDEGHVEGGHCECGGCHSVSWRCSS
jgi:hypothetical protein